MGRGNSVGKDTKEGKYVNTSERHRKGGGAEERGAPPDSALSPESLMRAPSAVHAHTECGDVTQASDTAPYL